MQFSVQNGNLFYLKPTINKTKHTHQAPIPTPPILPQPPWLLLSCPLQTRAHSNDTDTLSSTQLIAGEGHRPCAMSPRRCTTLALQSLAEWTLVESRAVPRPNSAGCDHLNKQGSDNSALHHHSRIYVKEGGEALDPAELIIMVPGVSQKKGQ